MARAGRDGGALRWRRIAARALAAAFLVAGIFSAAPGSALASVAALRGFEAESMTGPFASINDSGASDGEAIRLTPGQRAYRRITVVTTRIVELTIKKGCAAGWQIRLRIDGD